MTRLFARGELKVAILDALGEIEPANGYAIMQALATAIGGTWRPSPGAVYPAILGLQDAGLVDATSDDGAVTYRLTDAGRKARREAEGTLAGVADRARAHPPAVTVASLVDAFAATTPHRAVTPSPLGTKAIERLLDATQLKLTRILDKENHDG